VQDADVVCKNAPCVVERKSSCIATTETETKQGMDEGGSLRNQWGDPFSDRELEMPATEANKSDFPSAGRYRCRSPFNAKN